MRERPRGRVYLGVKSTGDDVESEANWCQQALGKGVDATARKIRISVRSKRWWNGEINERRCHLGREQRMRFKSAVTVQAQAEL